MTDDARRQLADNLEAQTVYAVYRSMRTAHPQMSIDYWRLIFNDVDALESAYQADRAQEES